MGRDHLPIPIIVRELQQGFVRPCEVSDVEEVLSDMPHEFLRGLYLAFPNDMRLLLIGCEYVGTTTLANGIQAWSHQVMGEGKGLVAYHDHWKIPHISGHRGLDDENLLTPEEQDQILALTPKVREVIQRYNIAYHIVPEALRNPDYVSIGLHIENAIYAQMYFDYYVGERAWAREAILDHFEESIIELAPDMPLVLLKASPETIEQRMKERPHDNPVLKEADIQRALDEFQAEFERSAIRNKFIIDTSQGTKEETLASFLKEFEPYLNESDKLRILTHKAGQKGEWI